METNETTNISFEVKLSSWLSTQLDFFDNASIQEKIFDIMEMVDIIGFFNEKETMLLKDVLKSYLKLSFILKNHPDKTEKLINFLK
ncbi:hypothetical protein [Riemerella columbipharyngis]|uniref:Uncharacterized protein n=1 Tax=Riemerella columbipharyngis TaxID=1071918 RepID=A0A1G7E0U3_9FLAO|nr:hypothetical protein [Riemerella columbipharyngis]SDE57271.1 hypothetical protein SAMN05421544_11360 [Riemerella columbipharyngis]